jgi:hypothetical protein
MLANQQREHCRQEHEHQRLHQPHEQLEEVEGNLHQPTDGGNPGHRLEHALAREALIAAHEALQRGYGTTPPRYDLLIGTGGLLGYAPRPGQVAQLLLDALQPVAEGLGSVELAVDTTMLLPALGNLAHHHLAAASYIFDRDCLVWLGTALIAHPDVDMQSAGVQQDESRIAVTVTVERKSGAETVEVPYGSIRVIPLRPDERAPLTVKPGPGFRVGSGEPGKALKTQAGQEVKGGLVGLIIDARGRPLTFHEDQDARMAQVRQWWTAFDAIPNTGTPHVSPTASEPPPTPPTA